MRLLAAGLNGQDPFIFNPLKGPGSPGAPPGKKGKGGRRKCVRPSGSGRRDVPGKTQNMAWSCTRTACASICEPDTALSVSWENS